jgi:hypothetical protein
MRTFPENFECLHFTEADFGAPRIAGQTITIPVKNLPVFPPHPLIKDGDDRAIKQHPALGGVVDGLLVFRGVYLSRRKLHEYIGDPMKPTGFKDAYEIEDINFGTPGEILTKYEFEGSLEEPPACLGYWNILARSFELQVE